ncbi:MAG: hypothetical protein A3I68_01885 [Candidatus Melainabacteria bacterium RIFCSPLOWO2_02_FULL_35_15]|nr:MAG: hypothetical protein A3F80_09480 [Candidatus Melainabacteria bacterium RIFCSPLOWO2_12_FULL_35_11]OGI14305.1 MAG: hypothetical protein A3I68_01885 [Candidatus Melainabacteria bacterium RIFCSPLOWO2_02_FULL_35_15]
MNRGDITTLSLRTPVPRYQLPAKPVSFINDLTAPMVEIDLPVFAKDKHFPPEIAAQLAVGEVIKFINNDESRVDIHCGNPGSTDFCGFRYTARARQAQSDVETLMSPETLQTIQDRTGKNISVHRFNDLTDGNPVISYRTT